MIRRVYEVDQLLCPFCGAQMKILAFIVDFVIIGSMAMAAQGLPRTTQDLDLFVSPEIDNLEALKRALRSIFGDPQIEEIDPAELAGDYPAVQYIPPHGR